MVFVNERAAESEVHLGEGRAVNRGMVSDSELPAYSERCRLALAEPQVPGPWAEMW